MKSAVTNNTNHIIFHSNLPLSLPARRVALKLLTPSEFKLLPQNHNIRFDRSLQSYIEAKKLITKFSGLDYSLVEIAKDINGKPYINSPRGTNLHISIAHSQEYIAVAIRRDFDIGIDIEKIFEKDYTEIIKYLNIFEQHYLLNLEPYYQIRAFLALWTRKEARVKVTGESLDSVLKINVLEDEFRNSHNSKKYYFNTINTKRYVCTIAV